MSRRDTDILLEDMLLAIDKALKYTKDLDFKQFTEDDKTIDAVTRNIEIVGEASTKLSEDLKQQYPGIDWKRIKGMRNRIVHDYFGVDMGIVWEVISNHLPLLKKQIEAILQDFEQDRS